MAVKSAVGVDQSLLHTNITIIIKECAQFPYQVNSPGMWQNFRSGTMSTFSLPTLEMQLVLIFAITQASYRIFKPMGVPPFASQLIVRTCMFCSSTSSLSFLFFFCCPFFLLLFRHLYIFFVLFPAVSSCHVRVICYFKLVLN